MPHSGRKRRGNIGDGPQASQNPPREHKGPIYGKNGVAEYEVSLNLTGKKASRTAAVENIIAQPKIKNLLHKNKQVAKDVAVEMAKLAKTNEKIHPEKETFPKGYTRIEHDTLDKLLLYATDKAGADAIKAEIQKLYPDAEITIGARHVFNPIQPPVERRALGEERNAAEEFEYEADIGVAENEGGVTSWMQAIATSATVNLTQAVAIIMDGGVRFNHIMARGVPVTQIDCTGTACVTTVPIQTASASSPNADPSTEGHGTHVGGIFKRFVPDAAIISLRVMNVDGTGSYQSLIDGLQEVMQLLAAHKAAALKAGNQPGKVILNASLEWFTADAPGNINTQAQQIVAEMKALYSDFFLMVAAAGNDAENTGTDTVYPSCIDGVFAVGAFVGNELLNAQFSNYGSKVPVAAVGANAVKSSWNQGPDNATVYMEGTSMAAPSVAGMMLRLWTFFPGLDATQLTAMITELAVQPADAKYLDYLSGGPVGSDQYVLPTPLVSLNIIDVMKYINDNNLGGTAAPGVLAAMQNLAPIYQAQAIGFKGKEFLLRNAQDQVFNDKQTVSYQLDLTVSETDQILTIGAASQKLIGSGGVQNVIQDLVGQGGGVIPVPGQIFMQPVEVPVTTSGKYTVQITRNAGFDTTTGRTVETAKVVVLDPNGKPVLIPPIKVIGAPADNASPYAAGTTILYGGRAATTGITPVKCAIADLKLQISRTKGITVNSFGVAGGLAVTAAPVISSSKPSVKPSAPPSARSSGAPPSVRPSAKPSAPPTPGQTTSEITSPPAKSGGGKHKTSVPTDVTTITFSPTFAPIFSTNSPHALERTSKPTPRPVEHHKSKPPTHHAPTKAPTEPTAVPEYEIFTSQPSSSPSGHPSLSSAMPTSAPADNYAPPTEIAYTKCAMITLTDALRTQIGEPVGMTFLLTGAGGSVKVTLFADQIIYTDANGQQAVEFQEPLDAEQLNAIKISNNNGQVSIGVFYKNKNVAHQLLNINEYDKQGLTLQLPIAYGALPTTVAKCVAHGRRLRGAAEVESQSDDSEAVYTGLDGKPVHMSSLPAGARLPGQAEQPQRLRGGGGPSATGKTDLQVTPPHEGTKDIVGDAVVPALQLLGYMRGIKMRGETNRLIKEAREDQSFLSKPQVMYDDDETHIDKAHRELTGRATLRYKP